MSRTLLDVSRDFGRFRGQHRLRHLESLVELRRQFLGRLSDLNLHLRLRHLLLQLLLLQRLWLGTGGVADLDIRLGSVPRFEQVRLVGLLNRTALTGTFGQVGQHLQTTRVDVWQFQVRLAALLQICLRLPQPVSTDRVCRAHLTRYLGEFLD